MKVLVTGGGGFVGGAIARALVARGDDVVSIARSRYPALEELGVRSVRGDLGDLESAVSAAQGCDAVIHTAAKAGIWGRRADFERSNVLATTNVLTACRRLDIPKLVFTSTPSVVHAGRDIAGGDESLPYAHSYESDYPRTKAEAEQLVLAADGPDLATVALRPHLVWGPGDTQLVPRILERARSGRLRLIDGGTARIDTTYIDDAAAAHLDALDRVTPGAACAGRAYFITSGDPRPIAEILNAILAAGGLPPLTASVPRTVAIAAGGAAELVWRLARRQDDPPMSRFLARQLSTDHWFDISAARRDLGYAPRFTIEAGMRLLAESLQTQRRG